MSKRPVLQPRTHRGTTNRNVRGSSYDRRRLRAWMIETFGLPRRKDGKKTRIPCAHCGKKMRAEGRLIELDYLKDQPELSSSKGLVHTWEVDRVVCGHDGGRYRRNNVVPACHECNQTRCGRSKHCRFAAPTSKIRADRAEQQRDTAQVEAAALRKILEEHAESCDSPYHSIENALAALDKKGAP